MKPYSEDLRRRIVVAAEGGMPRSEAGKLFDVSLSSIKRYCRLAFRKSLASRKGGGRPPKTNAAIARLLEEDVERRPV